jgi:acyl-CoA reductase-like NAD-dependent aldehyde dehydrogenase
VHLYRAEPFGPIDTIVVVDHIEELISEVNVSNGCLVSSIACDDAGDASRVISEPRAFKTRRNKFRSRGDHDEPFGGIAQSWKSSPSSAS